MLRHSVFAIVLVGAAFAGGAVMNGTGLAWFKALASGGPRIVVDGGPSSAPPPGQAPAKPFPTAPARLPDLGLPPIEVADEPGVESDGPTEEVVARADLPATVPTRRQEAPTRAPAIEPPAAPPVAATEPPDLATPPALDAGPGPSATPPPKSDPVARLASTRDGDAPADPPAPSSSPGPARDWGELRRKIRAAGIARYEIAAEVDGRVRFSCVIPVDGLRAVGHQFEAEGDDEFQAAEAALRRVALWRATESK